MVVLFLNSIIKRFRILLDFSKTTNKLKRFQKYILENKIVNILFKLNNL